MNEARELYANSPDVERTIKAPNADDMAKLADGEEVPLETEETVLEKGMEATVLNHHLKGTGDPVVFDDENECESRCRHRQGRSSGLVIHPRMRRLRSPCPHDPIRTCCNRLLNIRCCS